MKLWPWFVRALVAMTVSSACEKARIVFNETVIHVEIPEDGATVTAADDTNTSEPGIQIKVVARVSGHANGGKLILTNNRDLVGGVPRQTQGTVKGGRIEFAGYTLPAGDVTLRIALPDVAPQAPCDNHLGCDEVRISVQDVFCRFVDPLSGDILTAADEPITYRSTDPSIDPFDPFEIDVTVDCAGIADTDEVSLRVNQGVARTTGVTSIDATWRRATFTRAPLGEGPNVLQVTPQPAAGPGPTASASASATVTVNLGRCLATFAPGDGSRILAVQDGDLDPANGMQATLELLTDCGAATAVRVYLLAPGATSFVEVLGCGAEPDLGACQASPRGCEWTGTSCRPQAQANPNRFRMINVVLPESVAEFDVQVIGVVDEPSRQGVTVPTSYWVDSSPPQFGAHSPSGAACLGILQDNYSDSPTCAGYVDEPSCAADTACRWYTVGGGRCIAQGELIQIDAFGSVTGSADDEEVWMRAQSATTPSAICATDSDCTPPLVCRDGFCRSVGTLTTGDFVVYAIPMPATGGGNPACAPLAQTACVTTSFCAWDGSRCSAVTTLEYVTADAAGNRSVVTENLEVFDAAPAVTITAPSDQAVLGVAADLDRGIPALQYEVRVSVSNIPAGTLGTLLVTGQAPITFVPPSPAGEARVPVTLPDGQHTLRARVQDRCGNDVEGSPATVNVFSASQDVRVVGYVADNGAPCAGVAQGSCASTAGCMWNARVGAPACVADFTRRTSVADAGTVSATDIDLDVVVGTGVPGPDRFVDVAIYDTVGTSGALRVCTGVLRAQRSDVVPYDLAGALFVDAALGAGDNCVVVTVADGVNVLTATYVVASRTVVPTPALTAPTLTNLDAVTDDSDAVLPGFNHTVEVTLSAANDIDGEVELRIGDPTLNVLRQAAPASTSVITFADASLPAGTYDLVAVYTDVHGNSAQSPPLNLVVAGLGPAVVVSAPPSGRSLTNADFVTEVTLIGGTTPLTCVLVVDGAAGSPALWAGSPMTLDTAAPLPDGPHAVRAECSDGVGTGVTQTIAIDIDDTTPPTPSLRNEDAGVAGRLRFDTLPAWANGLVEDVASHVGLQHRIGVAVPTGGEDPAGWRVRLTVTPPGAPAQSYEITLTGGGDPTLVEFSTVDFGATEGDITFSVAVIDRAGNVSSTASATLTLDRTPPVVTQVTPNPQQLVLTRTDDQNLDLTYVDVSFSYTVTGAEPLSDLELNITPIPEQRTSSDFPMLVQVGPGTLSYPTVPLADIGYVARAEAHDEAGNLASVAYSFYVQSLTPKITWATPASPGTLNRSKDVSAQPGMQASFGFSVVAFAPGPSTSFTLCSNIQPPGATQTCRWGSDGQLGGPDAGWVAKSGVIAGTVASGTVFLSGVALAEGVQILHAEAREADANPDTFSSFFQFVVDSVPPVVTGLVLNENNPANDQASPALIRLNAGEGTLAAGKLNTQVTVTVSGSETGRRVDVLSDRPALGTSVGFALLNAAGSATLAVSLGEGQHSLTVRATDAVGNANDPVLNPEPAPNVLVDFTAGSVSLPASQKAPSPYTAADGLIDDNATPSDRSDDVLRVDLTLSVSDNQSLSGASLSLRRFTVPTGGTAAATFTQTLGTQGTVPFVGFPLAAGLNYLEASFTDAAGNVITSARELYTADFYGPLVTLEARNAASAALTCSVSLPCATDIFDPAAMNNRARLDPTDADVYRAGGTDLRFTLTGCANSDPSLEDCAATPITVRLESRVAGGGGFATVYQSTYGEAADVAAPTSYFAKAGGYALDAGGVREVRVHATDRNGNASTSPSLFLNIGVDGVLIEVERLGAGFAVTGDTLEDGVYWGAAQNLGSPPSFATHLRVRVQPVGSAPPSPTDVQLRVNGGAPTSAALGVGNAVDFAMVALATSPNPASLSPNTVDVVIDCFAGPGCGQRIYTGVIADVTAPTYQFDRCQLCALAVPLVDNGLCASCPTDPDPNAQNSNANIADPASSVALWNAAGDQDANPSNGFSILSAGTPLVVKINGVEDGELVTLISDRGGITGSTVSSTGCQPATNCRASFGALGVPSLASTLSHTLTVSFTDRAGNPAVPESVRGSEAIVARTDVLAPSGANSTVCIGESTTPAAVSPPESDARTFEDPSCAAECALSGACSRRGGEATLVWAAPGDDGAGGDPVVSYDVRVAALGVTYPAPGAPGSVTYSACTQLTATSPVEQTMPVSATANPGVLERAVVSGLFPHRSYCFVVLARDDLGNAPSPATSVSERTFPLINHPSVVAFSPTAKADGQPAAAMYVQTGATGFGTRMANLGDLDGDGRDDFAVSRLFDQFTVALFLSSKSLVSPDLIINPPSISASNFGVSVAGGDFDNDGRSDLAICATVVTSTGGPSSGANAGALYLYWGGVANTGIRRDVNTTNSILPSVNPDVALMGPTGGRICQVVELADVNGLPGADIVMATLPASNQPRVYGFLGGTRSRFPGSPPSPVVIHLDLTSPPQAGFANRPEFALRGKTTGANFFPGALATADLNGDGSNDVVVSDYLANHDALSTCNSCGEVYVYRGGAGLSGNIGAPDTGPSALMHIVRYRPTGLNFGQTLLRAPSPRGAADAGDWLMVHVGASTLANRVLAFKGTALGPAPGIVPAAYPPGGLAAVEYHVLNRQPWDSTTDATPFGPTMASLGNFDAHGGPDIAVGPGHTTALGSYGVFIYSFDPPTDMFAKRAILFGGPSFGTMVIGVRGFATGNQTEMVLSSRSAASLFLFR